MQYCKQLIIMFSALFIYSCSWQAGVVRDDGTSAYFASNVAKKDMLKNDTTVKVDKLDNGLTYYIKKNGYPEDRLELLLVVNAGSVLEDDDQQGLAHFAEHMAFNGTAKYPKQELVDYLESIGMKFGPDLNAYTSFDETVYMLQVPVEDDAVVEKAFEILSEWAHNISFDNDEIDKERGVIVEEWRLRRGANARIGDKKYPIWFKDSKYADRLPIGKMDIVENFEYDVIKRYYKDWYRPDLMAVVAVGDMDSDKIETYIEKYFSEIKMTENPRERIVEDIPIFDEYRIAIASDPELPIPTVGVTYFYEHKDFDNSLEKYKKGLIINMVARMLESRMNDLTKAEDPSFIYAYSYYYNFLPKSDMFSVMGGAKEDKINDAFSSSIREIERVLRHGFIDVELDRIKSNMKMELEVANNEIDKTESRKYKFKYKDHYLSGKPYPSIDDQLDIFNLTSQDISLEDVNNVAKNLLSSNNKILDISYPDKESVPEITDEQAVSLYEAVLKETIEPYYEEKISESLFTKDVTPGSILSENKDNVLGTTELNLSNGLKVVYKQTDFKNDEILFTAFSPGGHSLVDDNMYISATEAADIISSSGLGPFDQIMFDKYLSNKKVTVSPFIKELSEGFSGQSTKKDLETMFQMINLYFTEPKKDPVAFNSYMQKMRGFIENRDLSPERVFFDSVKTIINSNHFRSESLTLNKLDMINLDDVLKVYTERFSNPEDFTFIFVGNIEIDEFKILVNKYLSSLSKTGIKETWKDVGREFPENIVDMEIKKGMEEKSFVYLTFSGDDIWSEYNSHSLNTFTNSFKIKLREVLREDMGGTYGIWTPSSVSQYPNEKYMFRVIFGCDPSRVDDLTSALFTQIDSVKSFGLDEEYLNKSKEIQKNEFDKNIKENKYWLDELKTMYFNNTSNYRLHEYETMINSVNKEDIKTLANKYLNTNNYVKVVLYPEN